MKQKTTTPSPEVQQIMLAIQSFFDKEFYLSQVELDDKSLALQHYVEEGWRDGFDPCDWFSVSHYLAQNEDVATHNVEPFFHYLSSGKDENRVIAVSARKVNPAILDSALVEQTSPVFKEDSKEEDSKEEDSILDSDEKYIERIIEENFDAKFYEDNFDIGELSAIEHFITKGWKFGYDPCDWFSIKAYLKLNPDVQKLKVNPFFHYINYGQKENRPYKPSKFKASEDWHKIIRKLLDKELDEAFYRTRYQLAENESAVEHFITASRTVNLDPCPWFSCEKYLELNPELEGLNIPPFIHFITDGIEENLEFFEGMDTSKEKPKPISPQASLERFESSALCDIARKLLQSKNESFNNNWLNWTRKLKTVNQPPAFIKSHVELAVNFSNGEDGVLLGWLIKEGSPVIWAEDEADNIWFFDNDRRVFHIARPDVYQAFMQSEFELQSNEFGFVMRLPNCASSGTITLKCLSRLGVHILGSQTIEPIGYNPVNIANWMFGITTPKQQLAKRFIELDIPIIDKAITTQRILQQNLKHNVLQYGEPVHAPEVSIIIPLYGRIDFIENQMLCFEKDPFISQQCELIYVIDDPRIEANVAEQAEFISRLYGIPFKTVYGSANRGFSGANNLGAEYATGSHLLFLNSDVFPNHTGWLEEMLSTLQANPEIGVIAPRLLFADGSLQHAGIEFKYRTDLSIWINHHPQMGLAPELDANQKLTYLPAVTGACMLIAREDFDAIDGWDTGYLIGDFEDSDLCLKLRSKGKYCAYLPTVNLTHLERQSFSLTGSDDFRTKVVIYNATRHQTRWGELLAESV
ncbi:glycosyltransferase family 2 protein [Alteromonas alba]|uniref:glycosyltransferase family 2 protein n=1 Tax=Alteromonas alba TaxID=2079529 RepID=UPI0014794AD6|nr:glycosyltransferase family 2 protein [Alteromonas alba]